MTNYESLTPLFAFAARMFNTAWRGARERAAERYAEEVGMPCPDGFRRIRVHDLKHTFGRRLRAAGVCLETRKVLLGHKNGDITTQYSAPELQELLDATERVCDRPNQGQSLVLLRGGARVESRKSPAREIGRG